MKNDYMYEWVYEINLESRQEQGIVTLLDECFPNMFEGRTYYKQLPYGRFLLNYGDEIVGHLALDHRVMRVKASVVKTIGLIDLCVSPPARRRGHGSELLKKADQLARQAKADFLVCFADRTDLYLASGYQIIKPVNITWLAIDERTSHGMLTRDCTGTLLVKSVSGSAFPQGEIDLLGYLF
jgi:GNAT superfamily N-acetyltransferase